MTTRPNLLARWTRVLALAVALLPGFAAYAQPVDPDTDPPVRVGRVSYVQGEVSFSPAGNDEWVNAALNRPIVPGDRLWADADGRAEMSIDNSTWWFGAQTSVTVSNLDDRISQLQLHQGTLDVRVRRLPAGDIVEIDTPNLAFSLTRPGRYRVEVDPQDGTTTVAVHAGSGEVYGESGSYVVTSGQAYRFYGSDLSDNEYIALPREDAFDRWVLERDRRYDRVVSARYVSPEVVGYEDLDRYGAWSVEAQFGNVWFPRGVHVGWAPYREGHWAWIDPWGWTWVDDEPWGFAPFHYGRWAHFDRGWGWIPGPRTVRPVWAPALVAFVGGPGFSIALSSGPAIGWFPLGPREVYVPPYSVSRNYFRQVNVSNTVINNTTIINNYYSNPAAATRVDYVNRRAPNAVTAVPPAAFAQSQNVSRVAVAVPAAALQRAEVHPMARVAPTRPALLGAAPVARAKPPVAAVQRAVVAKVAPPPPPIPDAQKLPALEKNPGRPLNRTEMQSLRRAVPPATAGQPAVKIVEQPKPAPTAVPPARTTGAPGSRRAGGAPAPTPAPERAAPGQQRVAPASPPAGRPPQANAPEPRARAARPEAGASTPAVRAPEARPSAPAPGEPRAAPQAQRPPEARAAPQAQRPPQARAEPPRPIEARPAPQPQRPPEARIAPQPQRPPEARAAPQPQRPPQQARPEPQRPPQQARPEPQRPPEARIAPQPQRPPQQARPEPQRPPQQARPEPQRPPQQARPEPKRPQNDGKGNEKGKDKKDETS